MKNIKFIAKTVLILLISCSLTIAQNGNEHKIDMSSGKLFVSDLDKVEFTSASSNQVLITNQNQRSSNSDRAKGLKLINGLGLDDNTGIGLNVKKTDNGTSIVQISRNSSSRYTIAVPKGVTVVYENGSVHGSTVSFKEIANEIEVTTTHSSINLEKVTGPMTISTVHGDIEGDFATVNQENPISIFSTHGDIDLAVPGNTKAKLSLSTGWGEIFSDLDIAIDKGNSSMKRYGANNVNGTINGGGVSMKIASTHGSIYLREK